MPKLIPRCVQITGLMFELLNFGFCKKLNVLYKNIYVHTKKFVFTIEPYMIGIKFK